MAKREYSPEVKAAVISSLLSGQSVSSVAKEYDIPKGTVSGWKTKETNGEGVAPSIDEKKKVDIGDLLIDMLTENLKAAREIAVSVQDPEYLKKQDASDVAVLLGVINDKAFRMLEALDRSSV